MEKNQNVNQPKLYSHKEAIEYLHTSRATLYRIRTAGKISFRRIGAGRIVFTQSDLDEYIEKQKNAAYAA